MNKSLMKPLAIRLTKQKTLGKSLVILIICLLLQSVVAGAAFAKTPSAGGLPTNTQDHALIKNTVAAFVQQQTANMPGKVAYQVEDIDRRIVLPECKKLEAFLPAGGQLIGKTSVGVRCSEQQGWSIFVPVQIRISLNLLISARALPLGHTLHEEDIAAQTTETTHAGGITDAKQVIGKVLRYGISAGQVLREDMLRPPYSVTQGQSVRLVVQGNSFSIRSEGVALNNASEGQTVQVRTSSGRVISGIAGAGGVVNIRP